MSKKGTLVLGVFLVVFGLLGIIVTMALQQPYMPRMGMLPGAGFGAARDIDAIFIEQMIPHHDDAIAMADLALTRAEHPEIRMLAEDIKRTQTEENAQMRQWYREWYGMDVPAARTGFGMMGRGMGRMMGGGLVDLEDLADAEPFDKAFIEQMIPHHRMAIMMSRMAGANTLRQEIRVLTDSIVRSQSSEIEQMREWHREWYGR